MAFGKFGSFCSETTFSSDREAGPAMANDWIRLHRSSLDSVVFSDPFLWHLFSWCLLKANWKDGYFRGELIPRGSFVTGRESASEALSVSPSKYRRGIERLKQLNCITTKATNRFTVIRVEKYDVFQTSSNESGQRMNQLPTSQRPTDEPATDHNRRREEGKKERNKGAGASSSKFKPPTVDEAAAYANEFSKAKRSEGEVWPNKPFDADMFVDYYTTNGWKQSNGNPIKDWKAAVRNWGRNKFGDETKPKASPWKDLSKAGGIA